MKHTKITFYGGLDTIGGVVMTIEYDGYRVLLEAGTASEFLHDYFHQDLTIDPNYRISDALWLNQLPKVEGIYPKAYLHDYPLVSAEESSLHTAAFISHLHLDHMSMMGLMDDSVLLYLSEPAQQLFYSLQEVEPIPWIRTTPFQTIKDHQPVLVGEIKVLPILLNPEGYQSFSFYVETPDLRLHYTGDLLLHGYYHSNYEKEIDEIVSYNPHLLISETTSLMEPFHKEGETITPSSTPNPPYINDQELDNYMKEAIKEYQDKPLSFSFYHREVHRYPFWQTLAQEVGKTLVFEPESAYLYSSFYQESVPYWIPPYPYYESIKEKDWFKKMEKQNELVEKMDFDKHVLDVSYSNINYLFQESYQDGYRIHLDGEPIGPFDPRYKEEIKALKDYGITFIELKSPNYFFHSYPEEVVDYVEKIHAPITIPTHGLHPERLTVSNGMVFHPTLNQTYVWNGKELEEEK